MACIWPQRIRNGTPSRKAPVILGVTVVFFVALFHQTLSNFYSSELEKALPITIEKSGALLEAVGLEKSSALGGCGVVEEDGRQETFNSSEADGKGEHAVPGEVSGQGPNKSVETETAGNSDKQYGENVPHFLPNPETLHHKINEGTIYNNYKQEDVAVGIVTSPPTFYRSVAQMNTWILQSNMRTAFYFSGQPPQQMDQLENYGEFWPDKSISPKTQKIMEFPSPVVGLDIPELNNHLIVQKTFAMLKHLRETHPDAKWYFKVDDDTFVVPSNYLASLQILNYTTPIYLGKTLDFDEEEASCCGGHNSGGSGWTLSAAAMALVYPYLDECVAPYVDPITKEEISLGEDQVIWECLKLHIPSIQPINNEGQYIGPPSTVVGRFRTFSREGIIRRPITFHSLQWDEMFALEWLLWGIEL